VTLNKGHEVILNKEVIKLPLLGITCTDEKKNEENVLNNVSNVRTEEKILNIVSFCIYNH